MGLLDFFRRRRPRIQDAEGLADFIDRQAAFVAQKGIYEYSRARAGHYAKVLFNEQTFLDTIEHSRWRAYPLALALVTEVVEGVLNPLAEDRRRQLDALCALVLAVFDRYPVPPSIGNDAWHEARAELARHIDRIGLHAPKRVIDIPGPLAQTYFDMMPIHTELRGRDFPTTANYLKVTLCNVYEELVSQTDLPAVARALAPPQDGVPAR